MNTEKNIKILSGLILILIIIGVFLLLKFDRQIKSQTSSLSSDSVHKVTLDRTPFSFSLPKDYVVFHEEAFEGGYMASIHISKEVRPNYYKGSFLTINIRSSIYDTNNHQLKPSEYVDYVYQRYSHKNLEYITLFGNKAVKYSSFNPGGRDMTVIGYFKKDQFDPTYFVSKKFDEMTLSGEEFTIDINFSSVDEVDDVEYQKLVDMVLSTLKIK
ncbi:MAG: hypothetical protein AAB821_01460 [Patescibacteria group bacterium]